MTASGGVWRTARGPLTLDRPRILGILNRTPDSFSDGGRLTDLDTALARAEAMLEAAGRRAALRGGARPRSWMVAAPASGIASARASAVSR